MLNTRTKHLEMGSDFLKRIGEETKGMTDKEKAEYIIECHNKECKYDDSYYIISVTGNLKKYYTLYYYSDYIARNGRKSPYIFEQNLSQNFLEAVKKVILTYGMKKIETCYEGELLEKIEKFSATTFREGKYIGMSYEDVYNTDPQYILWLVNSIKERANKGNYYYLTMKQEEMLNGLKPYAEKYKKELKHMRSVSKHIKDSEIHDIAFKIIKAPIYNEGAYGPYLKILGNETNKYYLLYTSVTEFVGNRKLQSMVGGTVTIKCAQCSPIEIDGVKYNKLSRVNGLNIDY